MSESSADYHARPAIEGVTGEHSHSGFVACGRDGWGAVVVVTVLRRTLTAEGDGIEFGYRGAGPHRLARILLSALSLDQEDVEALAHDLVLDCLERLPRHHTTILSEHHFRRWVGAQKFSDPRVKAA